MKKEEEKEQQQQWQRICGLQSLKYPPSGRLQKQFANAWTRPQWLKVQPLYVKVSFRPS